MNIDPKKFYTTKFLYIHIDCWNVGLRNFFFPSGLAIKACDIIYVVPYIIEQSGTHNSFTVPKMSSHNLLTGAKNAVLFRDMSINAGVSAQYIWPLPLIKSAAKHWFYSAAHHLSFILSISPGYSRHSTSCAAWRIHKCIYTAGLTNPNQKKVQIQTSRLKRNVNNSLFFSIQIQIFYKIGQINTNNIKWYIFTFDT